MTDHRDCHVSGWVTAAPLPDTLPCVAAPGFGLPAQLEGYTLVLVTHLQIHLAVAWPEPSILKLEDPLPLPSIWN